MSSDDEYRVSMSPLRYHVMRERGTEAPFTGEHFENWRDGTYVCGACGEALFSSDAKFISGCGWPSFDAALSGVVERHFDGAHGSVRVEVTCRNCGSHLGHVFDDGPTATGDRYCINSIALDFDDGGGRPVE
ncbi:MAG: peptide-methionine (R)-S-oxide reductase MsrB [Thermoplasmata archaeon]|nr:peptide-methionine (R)-S-oxide reductase MsrB [Thermoplasmata archaeon]